MARSDEAPRSREWNVQILVDVVIEKYGAEYFHYCCFLYKVQTVLESIVDIEFGTE